MENDTLLSVRLKQGRRGPCIGDSEGTLRHNYGRTVDIVHATAESIAQCPVFRKQDRHIVAQELDMNVFDDPIEELNSMYGRSLLHMIKEDGIDVYEDLDEERPSNAYLHAALYEIPVFDAMQELDVYHPFYMEVDEKVHKDSDWQMPTRIASTYYDDGEIIEHDLREFVPELDWVIEHWTSLGGDHADKHTLVDIEHELDDFIVEQTGELISIVINETETRQTVHRMIGVDESIVEDEEDRFRTSCGRTLSQDRVQLVVDDDTVRLCGNC